VFHNLIHYGPPATVVPGDTSLPGAV